MRKVLLGVLVAMVAALSFSMAQAAQIDGLQTTIGPDLPMQSALHVYVNPGDIGDALIGGYYNARNALTFISLVNTSYTTGTVVKVRFREGKYSNEVLDFFVCLSAGDRWSAWVYGDDNPDNPAVLIRWDDDTPTAPEFPSDGLVPFIAVDCVTEDMTKEGYFTIIGVSSWQDDPGPLTRVVDTDLKCREIVNQGNAENFCVNPLVGVQDPLCVTRVDVGNYLTATVQIYDLSTGPASYAYNTTALADFLNTVVPDPGLGADDPPLLQDCQDGIDGLNYVLMKSSLVAFYDIEDTLAGQTDVVLTFPTKRQTLETLNAQNPFAGDAAPTAVPCDWTDMDEDPCEVIIVDQWDDEENLPGTTIGFSPSEPSERELCNEVNYIVVGQSTSTPSLLDTDLKQFTIVQTGFDIGWINFDMTGPGRSISLRTAADATTDMTSYGLPTIGYELGSFMDEYLTHMLPLRYKTTVQQTPRP